MKIKIYDYCNIEVEIDVVKEIKEIFVEVVSGDEIIHIEYEDGSYDVFDSCPNGRIIGFDDGCYTIEKDKINEWNDFEFTEGRTFSYERLYKYW